MHRFYCSESDIYDDSIRLCGSDVNHIRNVLRMKPGEHVIVNDGNNMDYHCVIDTIDTDEVMLKIDHSSECMAELPSKIYLFQSLPKLDKMELIIQKAVELGVHEVIPVSSKRCVVKLDDKKEKKKLERWQMIAESAAKQSMRGIIPKVHAPLGFKEAVKYASELSYNMIPYELAEGMDVSREIMDTAAEKESVGIFIGPEGGYCESEIEYAVENGIQVVSLGNRILRTETAGLCVLSILMFKMTK